MKHLYFWCAALDVVYVIVCFVVIFSTLNKDNSFIFYREYAFLTLPLILALLFQFMVFYERLTEENNDKK